MGSPRPSGPQASPATPARTTSQHPAPTPETPRYAGQYRSAIARAKRILLAAGFEWSRTIGRYSPFANTQRTTPGVTITRVGCSDTVAIHSHVDGWEHSEAARVAAREMTQRAIAVLRAAGLPFDDRGWLECDGKCRAY